MNSMDNLLAYAAPRGGYRSDWAGIGVRLMAATDGVNKCLVDVCLIGPTFTTVTVSSVTSPQVHNPPVLCLSLVVSSTDFLGISAGDHQEREGLSS